MTPARVEVVKSIKNVVDETHKKTRKEYKD